MSAKTPIVLVSTMYSPFQTELAIAINQTQPVDYHVLYTTMQSRGRGGHWTEDAARIPPFIHLAPKGDDRTLARFIAERLETLAPRVIVANAILRAPTWRILTGLRPNLVRGGRRTPVGYWLEHPDLSRPWPVRAAIEAMTRVQMGAMDFVFAIGDRAQAYYRRCHPTLPIHVVPYGGDLSPSFAVQLTPEPPAVPTFLFSGQLVARNNVRAMVAAFERLAETHPGRFAWIVSAGGPEEHWISEARARSSALDRAVRFDREFQTWNDRLRPFANSDVLVCPSLHAGWALVVPEAMAAGMPVIATRAVSAARWFVRPELSGLFVDTSPESLYRALVRFVDDPAAIRRMGTEARHAAEAGTAEFIGARFVEAALTHAG